LQYSESVFQKNNYRSGYNIRYKWAGLRQSLYFELDCGDRRTVMSSPEELVDIIKRIASKTHTDADLQRLGQIFGVTVAAGERSIAINRDANGATITTGDTIILNIAFQADGLLIGEKVYQGDSAEEVKSLLQKIFQPRVPINGQTNTEHITSDQNQPQKTTTSLKINTTRRDVLYCQTRNHETEEIKQWLKEGVKLIEITGFGGYGKSVLASQIFEDKSLDFFSKKVWINFSQPYSFNQTGNWLLSELNQNKFNLLRIDDNIELVNKLIDTLNQKHILLFFDNLETLVKEGKWVDNSYNQFLTTWEEYGQNSRIIITSRQKHTSSNTFSRSLNLKGLDADLAIKLLKQQGISGVKSDFLDFVSEVDGHPLLINFIVILLKSRFGESVDICCYNKLDVNLLQVIGLHRGNKESSLTVIFNDIFNELNPKLKTLVFQLIVYRNPFNFELAHSLFITNNNETLTKEEFDQLSQYSLLQIMSERDRKHDHLYAFQPLIKLCIEGKMSELQKRHAHKLAVNYYTRMCTAQEEWRSTNDILGNLEIFYHHCELKEYGKACSTIFLCDSFLDLHGCNYRLAECYDVLYCNLSLTSDIRFDMSKILLKMGNAYRSIKYFEKAVDSYEKSLKISIDNRVSIDNENIQYRVLNGLASICHEPESPDLYESIWKILENYYKVLHKCPEVYKSSKSMKSDLAYKYFEILIKRPPTQDIKSKILISLGNIRYLQNRYEECINFYEESFAIASDSLQQREMSNSLGNIGNAYFRKRKFNQSIDKHTNRLDLSHNIGDIKGEINSLFALGILCFIKFEFSQGFSYLSRLVNILNEAQIPNDELPLPKWFRLIFRRTSLSSSKSKIKLKI
jgi:tetratricopeptide (TPR) repeat protein